MWTREIIVRMTRAECVAVLLFAAACVLAAGAARADDFAVEASVDRNVVEAGRTLRLTITVLGASDVERPDLGDLDGFEVLGTSSSQNISMVNLKVTRSLSLIYTLMALQEGEHTLGPFSVRAGDNIGETEPVAVRVTASGGGASPPPARVESGDSDAGEGAAFAVASVDKKRAYVGEQITYTLRFAYRLRMLQGMEFIPPEHTGFWYEDLGDAGPAIEVIDGKQYYVVTKKLAFFPISGGTHTIGEAGIRYLAESEDLFSRDPFSLFSRDPFGRSHGREGVAMADPVSIDVKPLPAVGRPADFSGAVGSFNVEARATRDEVKVGESVTLVVKISGQGNLKSIADLPTPEIPGFRVFAPKSKQSISADRGVVGGEKRFEFVLVAQEPGTFTIDGIGFTYFDTEIEKYATAKASPIVVNVLPGDAILAGPGERPSGIDFSSTDIRHIHRPAHAGDDLGLIQGRRAILAGSLPVLLGIAGIALKVHSKRRARCVKVSARKAFRDLTVEMKRAAGLSGEGGDLEEAAAVLSRGITRFIAVRSGCSESRVDLNFIAGIEAVPRETRGRLQSLLTTLDQVRFAPGGMGEGGMENLLAEARRIMEDVNREWTP
jgi:hypothetical protein